MLKFVRTIAAMETADEMDQRGKEMDGDDACATLSRLISEARSVIARELNSRPGALDT